jgi:hypothetical protein
MTVRVRRISSAALAFALLGLLSACNKSTTIPSAVLTTDTLSGTVNPGGSDFKTFTVNYAYANTDAILTVTSIKSVATGAALSITIGAGFGQIQFDGTCNGRTSSFHDDAAAIGVPHNTQPSQPFGPGNNYCVSVYDAGTVTEPVTYTVTVQHY